MNKARVKWEEWEQDKLFTAIIDLHTQEPKETIFRLVEKAQIVLDAHRRRGHIKGIDHIPRYLRSRLAAQGLLKIEEGNRTDRIDPNVVRLNQVADERDQAMRERDALQVQVTVLQGEVRDLQKQLAAVPGPLEVIKNFLSDVGADIIKKSRSIGTDANRAQLAEIQRREAAQHQHQQNTKHDPEPRQEPKTLPVHLICGLRQDQRPYFETYFQERVRLKFYWKEAGVGVGTSGLGDKAMHADMVWILMPNVTPDVVQVVSHATEKFQRVVEYRRDALRDLIDQWLERNKVHA